MSAESRAKQKARAKKREDKMLRRHLKKQELRPTFSMLKNLVPEPPLSHELVEIG